MVGMPAGEKAGCENTLVNRRSDMDGSKVPRRPPGCSSLSVSKAPAAFDRTLVGLEEQSAELS